MSQKCRGPCSDYTTLPRDKSQLWEWLIARHTWPIQTQVWVSWVKTRRSKYLFARNPTMIAASSTVLIPNLESTQNSGSRCYFVGVFWYLDAHNRESMCLSALYFQNVKLKTDVFEILALILNSKLTLKIFDKVIYSKFIAGKSRLSYDLYSNNEAQFPPTKKYANRYFGAPKTSLASCIYGCAPTKTTRFSVCPRCKIKKPCTRLNSKLIGML